MPSAALGLGHVPELPVPAPLRSGKGKGHPLQYSVVEQGCAHTKTFLLSHSRVLRVLEMLHDYCLNSWKTKCSIFLVWDLVLGLRNFAEGRRKRAALCLLPLPNAVHAVHGNDGWELSYYTPHAFLAMPWSRTQNTFIPHNYSLFYMLFYVWSVE